MRGTNLTEFPNFTHIADTLLQLDLRLNHIKEIKPELLQFLKIELLKIGQNEITNFSSLNLPVLNGTLKAFHQRGRSIDPSTVTPEILKHMKLLEVLELSSINMTVFPDLEVLAQTLRILLLKINRMTHIPPERLNVLVKLERLELQKNLLSVFPDVSGPGGTLQVLSLHDNYFKEFPLLSNIGSNLRKLNLEKNILTVIPTKNFVFKNRRNASVEFIIALKKNNLVTLPPPVGSNLTNVIVHAENNPLVCDFKLGWMLWMPNLDQVLGSCKSPHGDVPLKNITLAKLGVKPSRSYFIQVSERFVAMQ